MNYNDGVECKNVRIIKEVIKQWYLKGYSENMTYSMGIQRKWVNTNSRK